MIPGFVPPRRRRWLRRLVLRLVLLAVVAAVGVAGYTRLIADEAALHDPRELEGPRRVGDYEVTPTVTLDAADQVRAESIFNAAPAHGAYALVELEVTYVGEGEGRPGWDLAVALRGGDGLIYGEDGSFVVLDAPGGSQLPRMTPGSTLRVTAAVDHDPEAVDGGALMVESRVSDDSEAWALG